MLLKWRLAYFKGGTLERQLKGTGGTVGVWLSVALKKRSIAHREREINARRERQRKMRQERKKITPGGINMKATW